MTITCVHYGEPRRSKATTLRPHQTHSAIGCGMKICMTYRDAENLSNCCVEISYKKQSNRGILSNSVDIDHLTKKYSINQNQRHITAKHSVYFVG